MDWMIMRTLRYLLVLLLSTCWLMSLASPIDPAAARAVASRFVASGRVAGLRSAPGMMQLTYAAPSAGDASRADYYVFQAQGGRGFVIVAGDDRARQVLAYGDSPIDMDNVPCNVQWLLDHYAEQMEYLFSHPDARPSTAPVFSEAGSVPHLLTTTWGQATPYRNHCPQVDGKPCVTGCVATSMAQVANYWRYPMELPALPAYTTGILRLYVPALPPMSVDWDLMLDDYRANSYTEEQADAVAWLMRYCGQSCEMDYTIGSSGAYVIDQLRGFQRFGYSSAASYLQRVCYTDEEWHAMLQNDLFAGRPVLYSGSTVTGSSHSFVLDGYEDGKYHVNWGWNGTFDGSFELDALNGGGYKPAFAQSMLWGVCPPDLAASNVFAVDGMYYRILGGNLAELTFKDHTFNSYKGDVVIPDSVEIDGKMYVVRALGDSAMRLCSKLTSVTIPATVKRIGWDSFRRSTITSIVLPDSVTMIGESAFIKCPNLTSVVMRGPVKAIREYTFLECKKLSDVELPASVQWIGSKAFRMTAITTMVIPDRVATIGYMAFNSCDSLTSVTIGESVDSIATYAFGGCPNLSKVVCKALTPPKLAADNCFDADTYASATLLVPRSALDAYRNAPYWSLFEHIEAIDPAVAGDVNGDGELNIADINGIISAILSGEDAPAAYDVNGDGEVNIADVCSVINLILTASNS